MEGREWFGLGDLGRQDARPSDSPIPREAGARRGMHRAGEGAAYGSEPYAYADARFRETRMGEMHRQAQRAVARRTAQATRPQQVAPVNAGEGVEELLRSIDRKVDEAVQSARVLGALSAIDRRLDELESMVLGQDFSGEARDKVLGNVASEVRDVRAKLEALEAVGAGAGAGEGQEALQAQLEELSKRFDARIAKSDYDEQVLKRMSDEVQQHRDGLYRSIVSPLLKKMVELHVSLSSTTARYRASDEPVPVKQVESLRDTLGDVLADWDVEVWQPQPGDATEPLRCKAMGTIPTDDQDLHGTIVEARTSGYAYDGKVLRPAQVDVYVYKAPPQPEPEPEPEPASEPALQDEGAALPQEAAEDSALAEAPAEATEATADGDDDGQAAEPMPEETEETEETEEPSAAASSTGATLLPAQSKIPSREARATPPAPPAPPAWR